jgi:hypothetical protein
MKKGQQILGDRLGYKTFGAGLKNPHNMQVGDDPAASGLAFVDAHVHFHDCFTDEGFLKAARHNIRAAALGVGVARPLGVLMLTESCGVDHFSRLRQRAETADPTLERTDEAESLLSDDGEVTLLIVAGRQVVTRERLEVLALATNEQFEDGLTVFETLGQVREAGGLAVVPWGFGKWWGRRGRLLDKVLESRKLDALGDNGGRPRGLPEPRQFAMARSGGIPILPGSDPLPFKGQEGRVGSLGSVLEEAVSVQEPADDLRRLIRSGVSLVRRFGELQPTGPFLSAQLRMQLRRRLSVR